LSRKRRSAFKIAVSVLIHTALFLVLVESAFTLRALYVNDWIKPKPNLRADKVILVVGDSISMGFGKDQKDGYPAQLENLLNQDITGPRYRISSLAAPSMRSGAAFLRLKQELSRSRPDLVITMIGKSDFYASETDDPEPEESSLQPSAKANSLEKLRLFRFYALASMRFKAWRNEIEHRLQLQTDRLSGRFFDWGMSRLLAASEQAESLDENDERDAALAEYRRVRDLFVGLNFPATAADKALIARLRIAEITMPQAEVCTELAANRTSIELVLGQELWGASRARVHGALGLALSKCKKYPEAERSFKIMADLMPHREDYARQLAWHYFASENWKLCISAFQRAIELDPNHRRSLSALGHCYIRAGQAAKGVKYFERLIDQSQEKALIWAIIASLHLKRGLTAEALHGIRLSNSFAPESRDVFKTQLALFHSTKKFADLDRAFQTMTPSMDGGLKPSARRNYRKIAEHLSREKIPLIAVQYPSNLKSALVEAFEGMALDDLHIVDGRQAVLNLAAKEKLHIHEFFDADFEHITVKGARALALELERVISSL
jgi:tetratricopeptide (TPR) repeat protein